MKYFGNEEFQKMHIIVYNSLRGIQDLSKKVAITTIVIISMNEPTMFAELMYGKDNLEAWINKINICFSKKSNTKEEYIEKFNVDVATNDIFDNLKKTLIKVYDTDGFFKGLYNKDEFALVIIDMLKTFDEFKVKVGDKNG